MTMVNPEASYRFSICTTPPWTSSADLFLFHLFVYLFRTSGKILTNALFGGGGGGGGVYN